MMTYINLLHMKWSLFEIEIEINGSKILKMHLRSLRADSCTLLLRELNKINVAWINHRVISQR